MTTKPLRKRRINQPHEVLTLDGKPIDWRHPPKPNQMCRWSKKDTYGRTITGSFRTLCHMNRLNNLAIAKFGKQITVIQKDWNTGVAASAGTHDFDSVWDVWIEGEDPWEIEKFFRANGLGGWTRFPPLFGWHYHGFTLPEREGQSISDDFKVHGFKVGIYVDGGYSTRGGLVTSSQIADYYNKALGLSGQHTAGLDKHWHPANRPGGVEATIFKLQPYVERRAKLAA